MKQPKKITVVPTLQQMEAFLKKLNKEREDIEFALEDKCNQIYLIEKAIERIKNGGNN